jgi:uncharacterized membrane protein YgdD (TMEM256/DUF423 family)
VPVDHDSLSRRIVVCAAISGALAVILGSIGAHGLDVFLENRGHSPELITKRLDQFDVGVRYHFYHTLALLALAALPHGSPTHHGSPAPRHWAFRMFLAGLLLFSGSLYLLVLTNTPMLGAITPIGGLCWIFAWLLLLLTVRRPPS